MFLPSLASCRRSTAPGQRTGRLALLLLPDDWQAGITNVTRGLAGWAPENVTRGTWWVQTKMFGRTKGLTADWTQRTADWKNSQQIGQTVQQIGQTVLKIGQNIAQ